MGLAVLSKLHSVAPVGFAVLCFGLGVVLGGVPAGSSRDAESALRKLASIESGTAGRGTRVSFTPSEINAWMREEAKAYAPQGVRNLRLDLSEGRATGHADIDFVKIRQATTGEAPGWIFRNLFSGERPVMVTARFESRGGKALVNVERVEISGIPIEGHTLDFVIDAYLRPTFPDVRVNEWFGLRYGIDHFTVGQAGVTVFMAGALR